MMQRRLMLQTLGITIWLTLLTLITSHLHYALPQPSETSEFNASNAMGLVSKLSSGEYKNIEWRVVGTQELVDAEDWLLAHLREMQTGLQGDVQMEVWHQLGDGAHLFDFMGKKVWKQYFQLSNIIVRLSSRSRPRSKDNAVLISAHMDSTLPSPGAADDLASVAVMAETIRVLLQTADSDPLEHSLIFLFNAGEECLQDASHLYITQHETRHSVRAAINLEAAGTAGREIVFQATGLIDAYANVPHPHATVLASEIFKTGIIVSDTDFRQFQQYGGLAGLDMAFVENSYVYHTTLDTVDRLQPASLLNMGENLLALLRHLTSADSTLLDQPEPTVFFSLVGRLFIHYPAEKATLYYATHLVIYVSYLMRWQKRDQWRSRMLALISVPCSMVGGILAANAVALIMTLLNKTLSWYRYESFAIALFGPPALLGMLVTQHIFARIHSKLGHVPIELENATLSATALFFSVAAVVGHLSGILSSYLFMLSGFSLTMALFINDAMFAPNPWQVSWPTYLIASVAPTVVGAEGFIGFLELFVPLGGRSGHDAPFDFIIASLVAGVSFLAMPWVLAFSHRFKQVGLLKLIITLAIVSVAVMITFLNVQPFDAEHPDGYSPYT